MTQSVYYYMKERFLLRYILLHVRLYYLHILVVLLRMSCRCVCQILCDQSPRLQLILHGTNALEDQCIDITGRSC